MALTKIPSTLLAGVDLGDSVRLNLGTDDDLALFHTGGNGVIHNTTGELRIRANNLKLQDYTNEDLMIVATSDGSVDLYHNNAKKFETTSTGASVTGNLAVSGNLTVSGTTTELDTTNLNVTDKNITLNYHASSDTSSNAGGAGITIQDAVNSSTDATILWDASNDRFKLSHGLEVLTGNVGIGGAPDSSGRLLVTNGGTNQIVLKGASGTTNLNMGNFVGGGYISNNYYYSSGHQADDNSKGAFEVFIGDENYGINYHAAGAAGTRRRDFAIDNTGKVGIGTQTPGTNHAKANNLVVGSGAAGGIAVYNGTNEGWYAFSRANANNTDAYDGGMSYDGNRILRFHTNAGTTRMQINANGDVCLGNTVVNPASGFAAQKGFGYDFSHGTVEIAVDSDTTSLVLGRNHANNGVMQTFRKQSNSFAEIGIEGGDSLYIQAGTSGGSGILCHGTGGKIIPARQGTSIDGVIDLGQASRRWKKLWCQKVDATDSNGNTSVGYESHNVLGASGNSGDSNVAIGYQANEKLTTGSWNNAHGYRAGMNVTTGYYNVAIGGTAMYTNQGGHRNTAVGYQAYYTGNGNDHNTAIGNRAMVSATTVGSSTAVGSQALEDITYGHYCTAVGMRAGLNITHGQSNTCVGVDSLEDCTQGANNTAIGSNAGANITTGSNNVMLGYLTGKSGHPGATTSASNRAAIGNSNTASFHCQTALSVASDVRDKTDFTNLDLGLDFIKSITPYTFKWDKRTNYVDWTNNPDTDLNTITHDGTHKEDQLDIGFKAQDIEALEVAANYKESDKRNLFVATDDDGKKNLKYEKLIPVLVKAIQELEARIATLEG